MAKKESTTRYVQPYRYASPNMPGSMSYHLRTDATESIPAPTAEEWKMKKHTKKANTPKPKNQNFPHGWDEERVQRVLAHYENQTEDEAVAEGEAAYEAEGQTVMIVPTDLVPAISRLIARRRGA
jgi:hypothetical protein